MTGFCVSRWFDVFFGFQGSFLVIGFLVGVIE